MSERDQEVRAYRQGLYEGSINTRMQIAKWLRSLDHGEEINRFLPSTLAQWVEERMDET